MKNTQNALPGFAQAIELQKDAAAANMGTILSQRLLEPIKHIDRATGYIEQHSPLFAGTAANPNRSLFTHDDPTFSF